jgi:hypothetical protein
MLERAHWDAGRRAGDGSNSAAGARAEDPLALKLASLKRANEVLRMGGAIGGGSMYGGGISGAAAAMVGLRGNGAQGPAGGVGGATGAPEGTMALPNPT